MNIQFLIQKQVANAIYALYGQSINPDQVKVQINRSEFEGNHTVMAFHFSKISRKSPEETAYEIGEYLKIHMNEVSKFNVVNGFLNLVISDAFLLKRFYTTTTTTITTTTIPPTNICVPNENYGFVSEKNNSELVMIEYSSPNTNKPLHLGHIRNNLLGFSLAEIMKASGYKVVKTNIVNDRGVHICKSMVAWLKFGNGETPKTNGKKGDHLVGEYYVKFDQQYKSEIAELIANGRTEEQAKEEAPSIVETREMLIKWEANDPEVRKLWRTMNGWVYEGFDETYKTLGVDFDKIYYESDTYTIGRDEVLRGVKEGIFQQESDGSVWANLEKEGLDKKILLRSDGTSVYITQDIGTAQLRYRDYPIDHMIYVVGNEQIYHFQVLSLLLDKLGYKWGSDLYHFSYGMVELPNGRMKSREGTVVDADDLVSGMIDVARSVSMELGKLEGYSEIEKENIYRIVALGALKYFILKVDPKKTMTFNPEESIDFNGNTGPFIQYTYARIQSIIRKANEMGLNNSENISIYLNKKEQSMINIIDRFPDIVKEAAINHSPAIVANYVYDLVKEFNSFYHDYSILNEPDSQIRDFRLIVTKNVGIIIKNGFSLLGIEVPDRM